MGLFLPIHHSMLAFAERAKVLVSATLLFWGRHKFVKIETNYILVSTLSHSLAFQSKQGLKRGFFLNAQSSFGRTNLPMMKKRSTSRPFGDSDRFRFLSSFLCTTRLLYGDHGTTPLPPWISFCLSSSCLTSYLHIM